MPESEEIHFAGMRHVRDVPGASGYKKLDAVCGGCHHSWPAVVNLKGSRSARCPGCGRLNLLPSTVLANR